MEAHSGCNNNRQESAMHFNDPVLGCKLSCKQNEGCLGIYDTVSGFHDATAGNFYNFAILLKYPMYLQKNAVHQTSGYKEKNCTYIFVM